MAENQSLGNIVYILTNEAMPGFIKIGTTNDLGQRIQSLSNNTSIPLPFECFYAARVSDGRQVERLLHQVFADKRRNPKREFFNVAPEQVKAAILLASSEEVTTSEKVITSEDDRTALEGVKRERFHFEMIGLKPGTLLHHLKDPLITCEIYDDQNVLFEGQVMSLSASALIVWHRLGYSSPSVAGTAYWTYNGLPLWEIRSQQEALG